VLLQVDLLDFALFKRMLRIHYETFLEVLDKITPLMVVKNDTKAQNSFGSPYCIEIKACSNTEMASWGILFEFVFLIQYCYSNLLSSHQSFMAYVISN